MERSFGRGAGDTEWTLAELVRDPLIGLVMRSDGVDRCSIELLFERVAQARWGAARRTGARP
jgi:hypothetical protein